MQLLAPTWFVGCGNMGQAMVAGWRAAGVDLSVLTAIRPSGRLVPGVKTVASLKEAGSAPRLVILGFKPQKLDEVAPELAPWLTAKTVIVSLLAGVEAASLRERFPKGIIVRTTTNLPVSVRRGVSALYSEDEIEAGLKAKISDLFAALGFAMWAKSEAGLSAIGAVAGAGPAYVARFIEAFADAAVQQGLSREIADTIALETFMGTAWMATSTKETMDELARRVASPKGTTEAGLAVLDRDDALDRLVAKAIDAARRRGAELAAQARGEQVA
jgi:pyrroline-5-carboxylate reductase